MSGTSRPRGSYELPSSVFTEAEKACFKHQEVYLYKYASKAADIGDEEAYTVLSALTVEMQKKARTMLASGGMATGPINKGTYKPTSQVAEGKKKPPQGAPTDEFGEVELDLHKWMVNTFITSKS